MPGDTVDLFLSPDGSDRAKGTLDDPFQTLARARDEVRRLVAEAPRSVVVHLRKGVYTLTETLVLGPQESAPEGCTVTWRGYQDETATLSAGVPIVDWSPLDHELPGLPNAAAGRVWTAKLPDRVGRVYTLYQGDRRLPRARTEGFAPDTEIHRKDNPSDALDRSTLHFPEGVVKNWPHLGDVELLIIPSFPWWMNILSFASVDEAARVAKTTLPASDLMSPMVKYARHAFPVNAWIENVPEGMTEPGRWMVDSARRKLYYWPTEDEPGGDLFAPTLRELIRVEGVNDPDGNADEPVSGICFENLQFTRADRGAWRAGEVGIQHDWEMADKDNAMLRFRGARGCRVNRCRFHNAGGNGVRLDLYAQHIAVESCLFERLGQSAVMMIGYGPGTKDVNHHNRIVSNHVRHCGEVYWHSQMITAYQSGDNLIAHNHIHHVPRKAICISGTRYHWITDGVKHQRECVDGIRWAEVGRIDSLQDWLPFLHSRNNIVEHNDVHDALEMLGDGAAINVSGAGEGNTIRHNYVHDIPAPHVAAAIRMDDNQTGTLVERNVVFNTAAAGITPKEINTIRNNFVVKACNQGNPGVIRGMGRGGLSNIERNILLHVHPERNFYCYHTMDEYGPDDFAQRTIDRNLYFCPGTTEADWPELAEMKRRGVDTNSVFADPLFVDWSNRDFRLRPDSLAHALGIEPIDISSAGLTEDFPAAWR